MVMAADGRDLEVAARLAHGTLVIGADCYHVIRLQSYLPQRFSQHSLIRRAVSLALEGCRVNTSASEDPCFTDPG